MTEPRLAEILAHLPPALGDRLACHPPTPWESRQCRLDRRDEAIRDAASLAGVSAKQAALKIERALRRHPTNPPAMPDAFDNAIARAVMLNLGKVMGPKQVGNILTGFRRYNGN